jgi:hypothetical protein
LFVWNSSGGRVRRAQLLYHALEGDGVSLERGIVRNGQVVLDSPLPYPDGTPVEIQVCDNGAIKSAEPPQAKELVTEEEAKTHPLLWLARHAIASDRTDGADEHDHYIYGSPKRSERQSRE